MEYGIIFAVAGAALSAALGGLGSALGIHYVGTKGAGVMAEKPDLFAKILIMVALPGSQGVYGLLIAILILAKIGMFGEATSITTEDGLKIFFAGALMAIAGLSSAVYQGKVVASGLGAVAKDESLIGKAITLSVIIETYAIFGLLVSLLIISAVN